MNHFPASSTVEGSRLIPERQSQVNGAVIGGASAKFSEEACILPACVALVPAAKIAFRRMNSALMNALASCLSSFPEHRQNCSIVTTIKVPNLGKYIGYP